MTSSDEIHEVIIDYEEFEELLEKVDEYEAVISLQEAVRLHGESTAESFDFEPDEITNADIGWLRMLWEAHHERQQTLKSKPSQ